MNRPQEVIKTYYEAFHLKDWKRFSDCLSDSFIYFTDGCTVQDKSAFIKFLSGDVWIGDSYEIYDERWQISEQMALCSYRMRFIGKDGDKDITLDAIETTVLKQENEVWKMVHSHTSNKF